MRVVFSIAIGAGLALAGWSQAVVEHAVITGAGSTGAAAGSGAGKAVGGIFEGAGKTLGSARNEISAASAVAGASKAAATKEQFVPQPVDPSQITAGMDREDLLAKCGKPSMRTSQTKNYQLVENYWYYTAEHEPVVVTLRDGTVASVIGPPKAAAAR